MNQIKIKGTSRFWLSQGVQLARPTYPGYGANSYLPQSPWREPTRDEIATLTADEKADPAFCVSIVGLPEVLRQAITDVGIGSIDSFESFIEFVQTPAFKKLQQRLVEFAATHRQEERDFLPLPPTMNPAGLPTTTYDGHNHCYLGLHLDSWDRMPLMERAKSSNRMSINLGQSDRYLLFMTTPMAEILGSLTPEERETEHAVLNYLRANPDQPVVKVRVAPGEAYIAPTENMIHDGSTEGARSQDVHLTVRGFFRVDG